MSSDAPEIKPSDYPECSQLVDEPGITLIDARTKARALARARSLLATFECSTGLPHEDEVERYVRRRAVPQVLEHGHRGCELLLFRDAAGVLMAVAQHEETALFLREPERSSLIVVVALRRDLRRACLRDRKTRLAAFVMEQVLERSRQAGRGSIVGGIVSRQNMGSLKLCERMHLDEPIDIPDDPDYVYMVGLFQ